MSLFPVIPLARWAPRAHIDWVDGKGAGGEPGESTMTHTITEHASCPSCGEVARIRTCSRCGESAEIIDCGHSVQPTEIAAGRSDGTDLQHDYCSDCADEKVWDFEGYWNTVLSPTMNAARIIAEYDLVPSGDLDEWLGSAEQAAWSAGGQGGDVPDSWAAHRKVALAPLTLEEALDARIEALRAEAGEAGDGKQVAVCDEALAGGHAARAECARVILAAKAARS